MLYSRKLSDLVTLCMEKFFPVVALNLLPDHLLSLPEVLCDGKQCVIVSCRPPTYRLGFYRSEDNPFSVCSPARNYLLTWMYSHTSAYILSAAYMHFLVPHTHTKELELYTALKCTRDLKRDVMSSPALFSAAFGVISNIVCLLDYC